MFSKALFKQSCKANGTMWIIITFAVCFMLASVMLISGSGNLGDTKNAIQDTIITKEIESSMESRAIGYYENAGEGLTKFDEYYLVGVKAGTEAATKLGLWNASMPKEPDFAGDTAAYYAALGAWKAAMPAADGKNAAADAVYNAFGGWYAGMPSRDAFGGDMTAYMAAMQQWQAACPIAGDNASITVGTAAYSYAANELTAWIDAQATYRGYDEKAKNEYLGSIMYALNPMTGDGDKCMFDDFYAEHNETLEAYDVRTLASKGASDETYVGGAERTAYRADRAEKCSSIFLAGNITSEEAVNEMLDSLSGYGVDREKYDSFNYTYAAVKDLVRKGVIGYRGRIDYEAANLETEMRENGTYTDEAYAAALSTKKEEIKAEEASSLLATLPEEVSDALKEVGEMDLYSLIVGSIFYKLAGILLPIIYMIMVSNNLIAGQVDSGSMAYVLSTSTKRKTVVFTQGLFLIGSLLAMFCLTAATGCVCLAIVKPGTDIELTYGKFVLLNVGAFLVLFALSGLNFLTSFWFDRSKRSMAIGGGLSIFALVAAMLGLFGSPVIPSVVRLDALNGFNYVTIISLFDVVSILDGTVAFIWKLAILFALGIAGYAIGSVKFVKKDLPL